MGTATDTSIQARVVLYGPPGAGKSYTLELIHSKLKENQRGELRTEELDGAVVEVLPVTLANIEGRQTTLEFVSVPGAWEHTDVRKHQLEGVDGVVFVAHSGVGSMVENEKSLEELQDHLKGYGKSLVATPVVFQWNHAGGPGALPSDELAARLNLVRAPAFPVADKDSKGIFRVFTQISKITLKKMREDLEAGRLEAPFEMGDEVAPPPPAPSEPEVEVVISKTETNGSGVKVVNAGQAAVGEDGSLTLPVTLRSEELDREFTIRIAIKIS